MDPNRVFSAVKKTDVTDRERCFQVLLDLYRLETVYEERSWI